MFDGFVAVILLGKKFLTLFIFIFSASSQWVSASKVLFSWSLLQWFTYLFFSVVIFLLSVIYNSKHITLFFLINPFYLFSYQSFKFPSIFFIFYISYLIRILRLMINPILIALLLAVLTILSSFLLIVASRTISFIQYIYDSLNYFIIY